MALLILLALVFLVWFPHYISYTVLKKRIVGSRRWDLNICCGNTDGGGVNADIVDHAGVSNFVLLADIYNLPFPDKHFDNVLSSHTIEHVDDPGRFYRELSRVGKSVTLVIPPLYDISAVLNIFEHKWIFLSFRKKHRQLPRFVRLPLAGFFQKKFGQTIKP